MDAEDILFLLHTSGTTAKPKAAQHTTGGYLTYVSCTHKWIFDIHDDDVWWCAADVGWVTGHSYIVYGPLNNGTTGVLYEGDPAFPAIDRHWEIVERYKVSQYYTAPTLIRAFIKAGPEHPQRHDLSSLKLLGTVGEPINPEAWVWYWKYIGGERCPIVDTWWQTENGGILITPLPGLTTLKPGSATVPFPGNRPDILDEQGKPVPPGQGGYLVMTRPWPGMFRTLWEEDHALGEESRPQPQVAVVHERFHRERTHGLVEGRADVGHFALEHRVTERFHTELHRLPRLHDAGVPLLHARVRNFSGLTWTMVATGVRSLMYLADMDRTLRDDAGDGRTHHGVVELFHGKVIGCASVLQQRLLTAHRVHGRLVRRLGHLQPCVGGLHIGRRDQPARRERSCPVGIRMRILAVGQRVLH